MPVGERPGLVLPRPHALAPTACGARDTPTRSALAPRPAPRARSPRSARRGAAGGCPRRSRASADAGRERTAADLDEDAVEVVAEPLDHLPADRAAAVEAERVLRALHAERHRAAVDGRAEAVDARVARRVVGDARAHLDRGAELVRARPSDPRVGPVGTNTEQRPVDRAGQGGRGERGVPARGDGERRPGGRRAPTRRRSAATRCSRIAHQVAGLVAAGDVARLVLHPHAALAAEAEGFARAPVDRSKGVTWKPVPSTARDAVVERAHQRGARPRSPMPLARGERGPGAQRVERDERVRVVGRRASARGSAPAAGRGGGRRRSRSGSATATAWRSGTNAPQTAQRQPVTIGSELRPARSGR